MNIQLSDHFTYPKLLRFTAPSIMMIWFISIYSIVDSLFVSNFVGSSALAAVAIVFPFLMIQGAFGFMIGTGGSALVAKTLGEKKKARANQMFSLIVYSTLVLGMILGIGGSLALKPVLILLGVDAHLIPKCLTYGYILIPCCPFFMIQFLFQSFLITAERPKFGLCVTVLSGLTNVLLDTLFILFFQWGLLGAAWATVISQTIGGVIPLIYFMCPNKSPLRLGKTKMNAKVLIKTYTNGLSEFISHISASVVGTLYNYQLLKIMGESGVVAFSIIGHVNFIFAATFLGYNAGCAPLISYHYGAQNDKELQNLFKKSLTLIALASCTLFLLAEVSAPKLAGIFVGYDQNLLNLTTHALRIHLIAFLLAGFNIFASAFFTALNNGIVSAIISCTRIFIFECLSVIILPIFWGVNGIWGAIIIAHILSFMVSCAYFVALRHHYHYM